MQMDLQAANVATPDDVLAFQSPSLDIADAGASTLVTLAVAMLRISAVATLMSPLLLVVWLAS
jgi:hypothetical protein